MTARGSRIVVEAQDLLIEHEKWISSFFRLWASAAAADVRMNACAKYKFTINLAAKIFNENSILMANVKRLPKKNSSRPK